MRWFNAERLKKILTFPVETVNLLNDGTGCVDKEWEEFTAQMWSEGASFFCYTSDSVDALSSCCRLKSAITSNVFSYTLGAGGIMTGSKGVITVNINRLVQNVAKEHGGKENITLADISDGVHEQISKMHKYMTAWNEILKDSLKAGMLPVYNANYIDLSKQYLTMGRPIICPYNTFPVIAGVH